MEEINESYVKYINKSFLKKLDDEQRTTYVEYIQDMHSLVYDLIRIVSQDEDNKELEAFIAKLVGLQKYMNLDEWKYYIIDSILEQPNTKYNEIQITEYITFLFNEK